jgi:DNA repair protein RecO (recombination protein O)
MEWRDEGFILGGRRHGETSLILEVMTRAHGRHLGLVKGGRGKRMSALLQPGNQAEFVWRARLDEHLGLFAVETTRLRAAALMADPAALHALNLIAALLRLTSERDPHPDLYEAACHLLDHLEERAVVPALIVRFELAILAELGFGLDLGSCAATGATEDLVYVSPKTGRAVSRAPGAPYADRLLALPAFLSEAAVGTPEPAAIRDGFALTGHFLTRDLFAPRGLALPQERRAYIEAVFRT